MSKTEEVIEVEAEEIQSFLPALNKLVDAEVARYDNFAARMVELEKKYSGIEIKDADDREGYEETKKAIAELRGIWVGTDKERTDIKAPLIAAGKTIEAKAQWVITGVKAIATRLIDRKDWYEAAKEKEKQDRLKRESERLRKRMGVLTSMGAISDGVDVTIGEYTCSQAMIKSTDDDVYDSKIFARFDEQFQAKEKIRIAEQEVKDLIEKQRKEEEDKLKEEQRKLKEAQDKLAEEQRKAEQERLRIAKERFEAREKQLFALGLTKVYHSGNWEIGSVVVNRIDIHEMPKDVWDITISQITPRAEAEKQSIQEAALKEQKRISDEAVAKALKEKEEADEKARLKANQEAEEKRKAEREELEASKDSEKWAFCMKQINKIEFPVMNHSRWISVVNKAESLLDQIKALKANTK